MLNLFRKLKREYQTLNLIEISKNNLIANFKYLSSFKLKVAPVIKSNGYGHGIINVAKILDPLNAPFFCVDSLFEAYELLKATIKTPILIMGFIEAQNLKIKKLPFSYALYDLELAETLNNYQPDCSIHIFVDTGMGREGVSLKDLPQFLKKLKQFNNLKIEGLMSHLASSAGKDDKFFLNQIKNFQKAKQVLKKHHIKPKWIHIAASGSIINPQTRSLILKVSNMVRAGLVLYGISQTSQDKNLKPALKFTTKLAQIKKIKKGEKVGYDGTYSAKKNMVIGVLPLGYYDGIDRRLSNKGFVMVNGVNCPIIGRVSMNITTIDISHVNNPQIGQDVLVYSDNPKDKNSIENVASVCKTIPYDILIGLAASTKRVVI